MGRVSHEKSAVNFRLLTFERLLDALEDHGFFPTGEYLQLNSYENRVFEIKVESQSPLFPQLIVKVYRPERWSKKQIYEEHFFTQELLAEGVLTVPPVELTNGQTFAEIDTFVFSVFAKAHGRMLQEYRLQDLQKIGRLLGRLHNVGQKQKTHSRLSLSVDEFGYQSLDLLEQWVAPEVWRRYETAAMELFRRLEEQLDPAQFIRIHGDFHRGNLLVHDAPGEVQQFIVVDFDDFVMGPEVQDFWMLLSGDPDLLKDEIAALRSGYEELRHFPQEQLEWIPGLRALRIVYYAAWIARRWTDPVFPQLFPQFLDYVYWAEETEALEKLVTTQIGTDLLGNSHKDQSQS